ncbi:hypothetical protein [Mycoplasma crocodyli]|uniref:Holliday junction DNA helicase RuvA n=1 Tax=Mycoplasma crocodyli (strain ATCC 51981 / MP145) TaxID=512564 RepID=D5E5P7_MYCCM|nr:hypothetical protein [Mycoplasma crocodyli]ADE19788.1 Holliday junction DNA helicase RuvA [Mycoplasma crocodyli MP145]
MTKKQLTNKEISNEFIKIKEELNPQLKQLSKTLKKLGFKVNQISYALSNVVITDSLDEMVIESIKLIIIKFQAEMKSAGVKDNKEINEKENN